MVKNLKDILSNCSVRESRGSLDLKISNLQIDSRKVNEQSLFFALKGTQTDGHEFIPQVISNGCSAIVVETKQNLPDSITQIIVDSSAEVLGYIANEFYNRPSEKIKLIGVTGTNGKTTTTTLLHKLYTRLGYHCGLISTVVNRIGNEEIPSTHTTPDAISLNRLLEQMVNDGCSHCFMEVSSHAIHQRRIAGIHFTGAVFSNITHDHLDYHKTFAEYIKAKKMFFDDLPNKAFALTNLDDRNGMVMLQNTDAVKKTYALKSLADFKGKVVENQFSGLVLTINGKEVWTKLIGDFNAYNLLAVFGVSQLLGEDETEVLTILSDLDAVEGRFQYVKSKTGIVAIIDYAHTPDALENVLNTIQNIRTNNETVFTVVGCGGDRDKAKRPKMAEIACEKSDRVILTSDNPRSEDPQAIIDDMLSGVQDQNFPKVLSMTDRYQAIKTAISMATTGDILLIAGKGHEKYQEIKGVRHFFDDLQITIELFNKMLK
jgi:UDP-N-acetylmuramoyl-L-alanyl-D-glutamate--2,6-diaminopimelate ligase